MPVKKKIKKKPRADAAEPAAERPKTRTPPTFARNVDEAEETRNRVVDDDEDDYEGAEDDDADAEDDEPPPPRKAKGRTTSAPIGRPPVVTVTPRKVISLDNRKLTKKDQARLSGWKTANRGKMLDAFFARQRDEARKKFGHNSVFLGSETSTLVIGIPCPSLAFEFVIGQDCFPLGLIMQIVAKHGVGKSGLLAEIGRWFNNAGGGMVLCENETKFNSFWYESILGPDAFNRMEFHRCKSVEDWQRRLTWSIQDMKRGLIGTKEAPGPGRTVPVLFGVDSIMGKMSEENQEKVLGAIAGGARRKKPGAKKVKADPDGLRGGTGQGYADPRSFPIEAGSITKYMRTIPAEMDEWPFSIVLINHLRMKKDDAGNQERNKTGGEQVNFQESFELELAKLGGHKKQIQAADFEGVPLSLSCEKNSFGPTHRKIQTRLLWWDEPDPATGEPVQKTAWDWDWSTVHLLWNNMQGEKASPRIKAALKAADFHLECPSTGEVANTAWSRTLGMTKDDPLTWTEVGAMIREDGELLDRLRRALRIARRPLMAGDYLAQMEEMAQEMP